MDSITQAALGGLCGEITLRKKLGWRGMAWGIVFGTLPDLDILVYPWLEPMERLSWHRGISHSILLCVVAAVFFGWLLAKLHRKKGVTFKQATGFVFITWFTHVLIDCFTSYGTQILEPFSNYRFSLNNMSIVDLSFTLPMLVCLLLALFYHKTSSKRTRIGRAAVLWLCLYTTASFTIKFQANNYFEKQLSARGIEPTRMMTAPTLNNIFLWRMVAETEGQYHVAYWSFFDDHNRPCEISSMANGHELLDQFQNYPETDKLIWFSKGWHKVIQDPSKPDSILLIDMRFTEMVTEASKKPVFVWNLVEESGTLEFRQVSFRDKATLWSSLAYQWQRIQGKAPRWMTGEWPWEKTQANRS